MSIFIPGMEMPKSCADCWFEYAYEFCEGKYEDCPLIHVPPHGNLIDRDALVKKQPIPELGAPRWLIEQAPTIIPAELPKKE